MTTIETPPADAPAADPEKKKSEPRPYVVLRQVKMAASPSEATSTTWEFVRNVPATSVEQAVREAAALVLATSETDKVTLVAIPARSFRPITVSAQIETKLKLG